MNFLIELLFNIKFFLGFIKNGVFPSKLSEEEEQKYIKELFVEDTHENARNQLIEHNLRLVAHIAKKYENYQELTEDLISIGTIGLIKAVDSFSLSKDVKLATYAAKCIENEILMAIRSSKKCPYSLSIYDTIGQDKDGSELTLIDVYPAEQDTIINSLEKETNIRYLRKYLEVLDDRELQIITLRYGLDNNKELTQNEIAEQYGISRSYVSRIEKRAITKLLQEFKKRKSILS